MIGSLLTADIILTGFQKDQTDCRVIVTMETEHGAKTIKMLYCQNIWRSFPDDTVQKGFAGCVACGTLTLWMGFEKGIKKVKYNYRGLSN